MTGSAILGVILIGLSVGVLMLAAAAWGAAFLLLEAMKLVAHWFFNHA